MSSSAADPIQTIAASAVSAFGHGPGKLLLYVEIEPGVISADLFFKPDSTDIVAFRFANAALQDLVYDLWDKGYGSLRARSWATMQLVVQNGSFAMDLSYLDQINSDEDVLDRRPRVLALHFPNAKVDYSLA